MIRKVCFFGPKKIRFMQIDPVLQTKNRSEPAKRRFSVALLGTHADSGQMYRVYQNQAATAYSSLYSFFFLFNFLTLKFFINFFSGTMRPRRLKLGTYVDSGQM